MAGRPRRWAAAAACAATLAVASLCYVGGGLGAAVSRRFDFGAVLTSSLSIEAGGADYATRPGMGYPWLVEGRVVEPWRETTLSARAYDEKRDYDVVPFPVHAEANGSNFEARSLTNLELFNVLDPTEHRLPYVYDAFSWDHCEAQGVVFPRLRDSH
jgi:hypothetical protein